jgi:hypothetical protein
MLALKAAFAVLVIVALTGGALHIGNALGFGPEANMWFATAVLVGAIIAVDPANRRR